MRWLMRWLMGWLMRWLMGLIHEVLIGGLVD